MPILLCVVAVLSNFISLAQNSNRSRPNIIYVMVDDLGYGDFSCYGQKSFQTPNIDAFTKSGVKFENAYSAAPVCTPTRVAFMTGRYPARNEVGLREPLTSGAIDIDIGLSPETPTISSILKRNGYETALFGKWHLGVREEFFPRKHGFDHFFGILSGAADYFDHRSINRNLTHFFKSDLHVLYENDMPVEKVGYLTDLITNYTTDFIAKKHDQPFFISVQYTAPHWPWEAPGDQPSGDTISLAETSSSDTYARMIRNLDQNFGRILEAIRTAGLAESTLIILTSDNGGDRLSSMGPFKGGKLQLWEGGIRVPAAAVWPGVISPQSVSMQPIITMDWSVTIADAANCQGLDSLHPDGMSLLPLFLDSAAKIIPRKFYWRISNRGRQEALRDGDWKYLRTTQGECLFNLAKDPYEADNLKDKMPQKFRKLKSAFFSMDGEMLAPVVLNR